ncbi:MAG: cyclase family protein, partial [Actinomycetota bacterium]
THNGYHLLVSIIALFIQKSIKTINSRRKWWEEPFDPSYAHLTESGAGYLAERRISLLGIGYLSVGPYGEEAGEVHRVLHEAGVWILEGLDLTHVEPGEYELICLPLRVAKGDGAPARAILKALP